MPRPAPRRSGCDGAGPDCQEVAFGPGVEPFADGAPDGGTHALLLDGVVVDGVGDATLPPGGTSGTIRFRWLHSVCSDWMAFRYEVSPVAVIPRGARIDGRIRLAIVEDGSAWSPWSPAGPLPLDSDDLVWRIWPANEVFTHKVFGLEAEVTLVGNDQARPVVQRLLFQSTCHLGGEELGVGLVTTPHTDSR